MSEIFENLPYSDLVHRRIKTIQKNAEACQYPQDLTYLDLLNALNFAEVKVRAGIELEQTFLEIMEMAKDILLEYGVSDNETALLHLEDIEGAIVIWAERKKSFDKEMQSKLANLKRDFLEVYAPLPTK